MSIAPVTYFSRLEIFSWTSEDLSEAIAFRVTELLHSIAIGETPFDKCEVPLDPAWAQEWLSHRLDASSIPYIQRRISQTPRWLDTPVLFCEDWHAAGAEPVTATLIDGSHRYAARMRFGLNNIRAHLVRWPHWRRFAEWTKGVPPT